MTVALIALSCAFTAYMLYHMVSPFFQARSEQVRFDVLDGELRQVEELVSVRAMLLSNLSELEHDHEVGKVADEDYRSLKKSYERRAIGVMRRLDAIHGGRDWEARIEAELMRRRARPAHPDAAAPEPEPTPLRSPEVVDLLEPPKHTIVCPQCGKEMEADASFCSSCGASLSDLTPDTPETLTRQRTEVNG